MLNRQTIKTFRGSRQLTLILFILIFAGIGVYLLTSSHASGPYISLNADKGTLANGATVQSDSNASDGKYIKFPGSGGGGGGVIWSANGTSPIYKEWGSISDANSCGVRTTATNMPDNLVKQENPAGAPPPRGTAYHFILPAGDTKCYAGRTQLGMGNPANPAFPESVYNFNPGQDLWIAYNMYFPSNYLFGRTNGLGMSIHQQGGCNAPPFFFAEGSGSHGFSFNWTNSSQDCPVQSGKGGSVNLNPTQPFQTNQWYRFEEHIKFEDSPTGSVTVYINMNDGKGMQVHANVQNIYTLYTNAYPTHVHIGTNWDGGDGGSNPGWDQYVADFTVANSQSAAENNAFASVGP
jgi:Polysaccharide lyase